MDTYASYFITKNMINMEKKKSIFNLLSKLGNELDERVRSVIESSDWCGCYEEIDLGVPVGWVGLESVEHLGCALGVADVG